MRMTNFIYKDSKSYTIDILSILLHKILRSCLSFIDSETTEHRLGEAFFWPPFSHKMGEKSTFTSFDQF